MRKPRTQGETKTIEAMKEVLDEEEWISRKELAKKIDEESKYVAEASARSNLSTYRKYLEKNGFETKEEPEPRGNATVYWRRDS